MTDNKLLGASGLYFGVNEISKAYMGNNLVWEKAGETGPDYSKEYFCIEAIEYCDIIFEPYSSKVENGHRFLYIIFHDVLYHGRPPMDFLYDRFYNGEDYEVFDPYSDHLLIISLLPGDAVYMVGNMDKGVSVYDNSVSNIFTFSGKVNLSGNIMSLTHGLHRNTLNPTPPIDLPEKAYTSSSGELARLFTNQPVVDAGNLVLSSSRVHEYTYYQMFYGCTYLTTAPELSATTLANSCYREMFKGCSSLTTAPKLPATTLANNCYRAMFSGCAFTIAPTLPAETLAVYCYYYMFENCTSLTTAPELPATTLKNYCYQAMFTGCTSLTTAPELPATTLTNYCYRQMFLGCTSLRYVKCLATNISASNCTAYWLKTVASSGTFVKPASMTSWTTGTSGIPSGWTVQTASS